MRSVSCWPTTSSAGEDVPPFANSAVDGYAVVAGDTAAPPADLTVVGELAAGAPPPAMPITSGQTIRIMTGAPMPAGADAVVMVEDSELLDRDTVRLSGDGDGGDLGAGCR